MRTCFFHKFLFFVFILSYNSVATFFFSLVMRIFVRSVKVDLKCVPAKSVCTIFKAFFFSLSSSSTAYVDVTKVKRFYSWTRKGRQQNWISKQKSFNNFPRTLLKRCMGADFETFNYQLTKPSAKLVSTNATICKQWSNKILPSSTSSVSNLRFMLTLTLIHSFSRHFMRLVAQSADAIAIFMSFVPLAYN